jgi:hypothetical protein
LGRRAKEFVAKIPQNPLAFGQNETTRSDARIFSADNGTMIGQMAESQDFFLSTCSNLLQRMTERVPSGVKLSDIIDPIQVKPLSIIQRFGSNKTMSVKGQIRVRDEKLLQGP